MSYVTILLEHES